jgi:hypothetical protein
VGRVAAPRPFGAVLIAQLDFVIGDRRRFAGPIVTVVTSSDGRSLQGKVPDDVEAAIATGRAGVVNWAAPSQGIQFSLYY